MKKIFMIIVLTVLLCFLIYKFTNKKNKQILALGDSSCLALSLNGVKQPSYNYYLSKYLKASLNDKYCQKSLKVTELYLDINNNKNHILEKLDKADYITIMIGFDELTFYKKVNNEIKKEFLESYSNLVKVVSENTKAKIIIIGYYPNYFNNVTEINSKLKIIANNNGAIYIDLEPVSQNESNFYDKRFFNLNNFGNEEVFNVIRNEL